MDIWDYDLLDSILSDQNLVFNSKFGCSLCYFLRIKRKLSTTFHPQTNGQTKKQNNIMEAYLQAFVYFKQDDWARLLPMAELAYNNAKNISINHMPLELNSDFHPWVFYKEDVDLCS